jgi:hypothetical protein
LAIGKNSDFSKFPCYTWRRIYFSEEMPFVPKMPPFPGMITREAAARVLIREKIITSSPMISKLKGLDRVVPEGRTHGFYREDQLLSIINSHRQLYGLEPLATLFYEDHNISARQATPEDIYGAYNVAVKLFGPTSPASERIPLLERCPEGNLVLVDNNQIVGFAVILPMKQEPLMKFLAGKFRGSQITADHLDPFAPGKAVDILIKAIGVHHESTLMRKVYGERLLMEVHKEIIRWGLKGYIINKIYCTSEEPDGITLALEMKMQSLGRISGSRGKRRYAFELDPYRSTSPMIRGYNQAIEGWRDAHPQEWDRAWEEWKQQKSAGS